MIPVLRPFLLLFLAMALVVGQPVNSSRAQESVPVAFSGSVAGDEGSTRFFVDFSGPVSVQTFYMDNPDRVIIDLSDVTFDLAQADALKARGLVTDVRLGRISKGRSRIVLTLAQPSEIMRASMQKVIDEDHYRFLLDLEVASRERFATLLNAQRVVLGESGNVAAKGDRVRPAQKEDGRFTIVLDPGHGGIDGGATGRHGVKEKDIVLAFARKLRDQLSAAGPFDVKLTRDDDVFMSLRERLEFNRRMEADLFISVHADSLDDASVRGSTIYTLSKRASDRLSERLAEAENKVDLLAGLQVMEDTEAITDILIDLTTRETKTFSAQFSRILMTNLGEEVRLIKNPVRSAAFGVLKAPDVPGVLLELGYLSNDEDEKLMQSEAWRKKAASAVTRAVVAFFKPRMP